VKKESKEAVLRKQMKAVYDYNTDTLTVIFSEAPVVESDEDLVSALKGNVDDTA